MVGVLAIVSAFVQASAYFVYFELFRRRRIRPNAASQLMFAYGTTLLVLLELSDGARWPVLALPATCATLSIIIAVMCLREGATDPVDDIEKATFSADIVLTMLWAAIAFGYGDIAPYAPGFLIAGNATTLTSFFPVLRSTWRTPEREEPLPWAIWTLAYAVLTWVTVLSDRLEHPALMLYPVLSVLLHGAVATMAWRGSRMRIARRRWADEHRSIYVDRSTIHGDGIFAGRPFAAGDVICTLTGTPIFGAVTESGPNYIGIGPDVWIDPALPLDHINHHCTPNVAMGQRRQLRALRPIRPGEEFLLDYSTTECDPDWQMACGCGAPNCRQVLYPIQKAFADWAEPPAASPLMQRIWHKRHDAYRHQLAQPMALDDHVRDGRQPKHQGQVQAQGQGRGMFFPDGVAEPAKPVGAPEPSLSEG